MQAVVIHFLHRNDLYFRFIEANKIYLKIKRPRNNSTFLIALFHIYDMVLCF